MLEVHRTGPEVRDEGRGTHKRQCSDLASDRCINSGARFVAGMHNTMPGVWCSDGPPKLEAIPPMPTSDLQDLEMWPSNWNCELRNALELGDTAIIAKVGALVGQGTAALTSFATVAPMEGHNEVNIDGCVDRFSGREETMLASRFKPCVSIFSREPSLNDAWHGLRGVRVGRRRIRDHRVRPRVAKKLLRMSSPVSSST